MYKVMVIEDDVTMLSLLKTLLEIEGFQVIQYSFEDGPLAPILREKPDIIILDVHLRSLSGLELLRSIRSTADIRDTRVIMSSGKDVRADCISAGADDFLLKPFMPDDLIKSIWSAAPMIKKK
jgi:DNA-binding response OmpR family regulator